MRVSEERICLPGQRVRVRVRAEKICFRAKKRGKSGSAGMKVPVKAIQVCLEINIDNQQRSLPGGFGFLSGGFDYAQPPVRAVA